MPYTNGPRSVADEIESLAPARRRAFTDRLDTLVATLTGGVTCRRTHRRSRGEVGHEPDLLWLAHSVLAAELPTDDDMSDLLVRARLGGTWAALAPLLDELSEADRFRDVEVLRAR